jgi:hypothetical protein
MNTSSTDLLATLSATQEAPSWWQPDSVNAAIDALGVEADEVNFRERITNFIYAQAVIYRNAPYGDKGPEPKAIQKALDAIPAALLTIGESLDIIWQARLAEPAQESERAANLYSAHVLILDSFMRRILPSRLIAKFEDADLNDCLPSVAINAISNPWNSRFSDAATRLESDLSPFSKEDWTKGTTRPRDQRFDNLIKACAEQFSAITNAKATAYNRGDDSGHTSKFAVFIAAIWCVFGDESAPSNVKITSAIKSATDYHADDAVIS